MQMNRRMVMGAGLGASLLGGTRAFAQTAPPGANSFVPALAQPTEAIDLWPRGAPGAPTVLPVEEVRERSADKAVNDRALLNIAQPRMAVFKPLRPNGASLIITPGGGYNWVVIDKEGYELASLLTGYGITVFVLFYRLPQHGWAAGPDVTLSDAQRAVRLVRSRARDFAIDPARVSVMGFSAGGHVCADLATRFDAATYAGVDAADRLSARPFLSAPIYPVVSMRTPFAHAGSRRNLLGESPDGALVDAHSPDRNVPGNAPPTFLVHAEDDDVVPVDNSLMLRAALRAKGVSVETHLFTHGGHGFGIRRAIGKPAAAWPDLFLAWARTQGWFSA